MTKGRGTDGEDRSIGSNPEAKVRVVVVLAAVAIEELVGCKVACGRGAREDVNKALAAQRECTHSQVRRREGQGGAKPV